jgi:catechol-2,3-dioxygenase
MTTLFGNSSAAEQPGSRRVAPAITGLAELTLETDDLVRCERFYRELLGLELLSRERDRVWLAVGRSTRLGLWSPGRKEFGDRGGRHVHFAFSASPGELDALADRLRAAGGAVRGPVEHDGGDRSLYFRDPAGNLVEAWDYFQRPEGDKSGVEGLA